VTALEPLELALGMVLGQDTCSAAPALDAPRPLTALERPILAALRRSPCLVSFSGGRDSSAVLALAVRLARREGLPDPIPATIRASEAPAADEASWQELVVARLGLSDWLRLEVRDELDVVGPVAQRVLRRHGLLWPFNAHFHLPLLEAARGGALLTGIGGDELFNAATSRRPAAVLAGRVRPVRRDVRRIVLHVAPAPFRRWWHRRDDAMAYSWLTPEAADAARREYAHAQVAEPRRMRPRLRHVRAARYLRVGTASLERLAAEAGTALEHPLLDRGVWAAVSRWAPRGGYLGRDDAMRDVFGDLLPAALHGRRDKACFDEVFFHHHSRRFAAAWTAGGVPPGLVDAGALRAEWRAPAPRAQSFTLLQAAWLASAGDGADEPPAGLAQRVPAARAPQSEHRQ
jgi:hypothetical protein